MKFSLAAVSAFVAYALAKPALTNTDFNIQEGVDYTLEWKNATGPVTLTLMTGPDADHMTPFKTIASGVTGDSYTWTPEDVPSGTYAFKIADGDSKADENYSVRFPYVGSAEATSSAASTLSTVTKTSTSTVSTMVSSTVESSTIESSSAASSTDASSTATSAASSAAATTTSTRAATSTGSAPTSMPPNTNNAERFASPLALILGTVAALVFFN
ncbi:hypothetical protein B0H65DRAFT_55342 [Neurospora tetraspora]|uniref:Extracellular matrix protein n=1 Tax=Neurospora tetraspora TaxID=94610 RepID=A0AAE0MX77_9PEZI|nr:hypothetical protein B0H65DRAFT_55342 [Neurospora tetraspora]